MPFVVEGNRGSGGGASNRLVLGAVETSHVIVDGALELDGDRGLARNRKLLVKGDGSTLGLFIVGEVCRLPTLRGLCVVDRNLGTKQLKLEGVDDNLASRLEDFGLDTR